MIPKDPVMLLSYINLKLRDFYPSLDAFAEDTGENYGRTVIFYPETGEYLIRAIGKEPTTIQVSCLIVVFWDKEGLLTYEYTT